MSEPALERRVTVVETRLETLMVGRACGLFALAQQFHTMNERMNDIRAWLIALTALAGLQFTAMLTLAILVLRR
jgi:hypothetical protein